MFPPFRSRTVLFSNGSISLRQYCLVTLGRFEDDDDDIVAADDQEDFDRRAYAFLTKNDVPTKKEEENAVILDPFTHWKDLEASLLAGVDAMEEEWEAVTRVDEGTKRAFYEYLRTDEL